MLTSKQRAYLRSLANKLDTILIVGKGEITDNIIRQADTALTAREIIKGKVLENSAYSSREAAEILAENALEENSLRKALDSIGYTLTHMETEPYQKKRFLFF